MNSNINASKKRKKKSFANDRLKRLRTTLNEEIVTPTSTNISKTQCTPSVKNNIQNNPQGYPERKKLVPVRKLKVTTNAYNSINANRPERNDCTAEKSLLSGNTCFSKEKKNETFGAAFASLEKNFNKSSPSSSRSITSTMVKPVVVQRDAKLETNKFSTITKKSTISIDSKSNKLPARNSFTKIIEKAPQIVGVKTTSTNCQRLETVTKSQLAKIRSNECTSFSDICSTKTKFEYQHAPKVQTPVLNKKSSLKGASLNSENYIEYFGQAMKSLHSKFFNPDRNATTTQATKQVPDADSMDWEPDVEFTTFVSEHDEKTVDQVVYIIVDTNIFLDSLSVLQGIVTYGSEEGIKPVIYVPWMVFNELDFIKDNKTSGLKSKASRAIDFINKMLMNKEGKLIGQSIFEANNQMYVGKSPDDKITSCCLQVKEKGFNTVLLSNDKNLRNKLIINGIPSLSCDDLMKYFDDISPHGGNKSYSPTAAEKLLDKMSKCCTIIIIECCVEAYGSVWNKLALLDNQPWTFKACLEIFKKYWSAVFSEKLLKQCLKTVEKMIAVLKSSASLKNSDTFDSFAKDCLSLCFFLTDLEQHKDLIAETTKEINMMIKPKS